MHAPARLAAESGPARRPSSPLRGFRDRPQLRAPRFDRAQSLRQSRPRPRLHFLVAQRSLTARCLQVLEPGVGLLDHEQLVGFALSGHLATSRLLMRGRVGPPSDDIRRRGARRAGCYPSSRCTFLTVTTCRARSAPPLKALLQRARTKEFPFALVPNSPTG